MNDQTTATIRPDRSLLPFAATLAMALASSAVAGGPGDCNGNGVPDKQDIASGASLDCDGDGVPDECMPCLDPDGNGLLDPCERSLGAGVVAQYFRSDGGYGNFSQRLAVRVEDQILTSFPNLPEGVPSDNFCVRYTGLIVPPATGNYSIRTTSDDGARLWIDGVLVIDEWRTGSYVGGNVDVDLVAGVPVRIRLDYFDRDGGQNVALSWSPPDQPYQNVPSSVFLAFADADGDGWSDLAGDCDGDGIADPQAILDGAADCDGNCVPDACDLDGSAPAAYWRFEQGGATVLDSGPLALDGDATGSSTFANLPVTEIPRTGAPNTLARSFTSGRMVVEDPAGDLSFGESGFTFEAWVRPANAGGNAREMLLQRKRFDDPDTNLEYAVYLRGGNLPTSVGENFGKSGGFTGREIVVRFGDGRGGDWAVTSNLEAPGGAWSHVSVAVGSLVPGSTTVRFGVDGVFETIEVPLRERILRSAPIVVAAHTNANGAFNQFLNGAIDELRMSRGFLPASQLLDDPRGVDCDGSGVIDACEIAAGLLADCNNDGLPNICDVDCDGNGQSDLCQIASGLGFDCDGNGVLDACDIAADPSIDCDGNGVLDVCELANADCNGNGIVDACDLAAGDDEDCDGDNVPDACQVNGEIELAYDDGEPESAVRSNGSYMAWLNAFEIAPGSETLLGVELMTQFIPDFQPMELHVWNDPNGDGNPQDATSLWSTIVFGGPGAVLRRIEVPAIDVGTAGGRFFVGCVVPVTDQDFPAALDTSGNPVLGRSWLVGSDFPIDANDLSATASEFQTVEQALFPGNWILRAIVRDASGDCDGNGVPDQCDIQNGLYTDVDGNGVPDQCEDCNQNGVPDGVDIASGVSEDCQQDGVPDECQGPFFDCDFDGVPDVCELDGNDCNGNEIPDNCEIDSGEVLDLDGNGVPDECEDCNGNGEIDALDILFGDSEDCDGDGVPDECQFGTPETDFAYVVDDGTRESNLSIIGATSAAWMHSYQVVEGHEWIGGIEVMWGNTYAGIPAKLVVWSDPDQDGSPLDAQAISIGETTTRSVNSNTFVQETIPPVYVGPAGTRFFVGVLVPDMQGTAPTALDIDTDSNRFWVAAGVFELDPNDLGGQGFLAPFSNFDGMVRGLAFDGLFPGDCNRNGIIDACDILDGFENDANGNGIPDSCEPCPADLDGNGSVGAGDLAIVLASWSIGGSCGTCLGDLDGDGVVNAGDLAAVLAAWGPCGP
ncbi:MAG: PA14 domain-containing protein [Phycisphaerales bacterium]